MQIVLNKQLDNVLASADEFGIWIIGVWTVGISKDNARKYRDHYNSDASVHGGFFEHEGSVILTHGDSKMTLSQEEAKAVIDLINDADQRLW